MKKLCALLFVLTSLLNAQDNEKACKTFSRVSEMLQQNHFKPKKVDDSLSVFVFNQVVDGLDDNHVLFTATEFDKLAVHKNQIDDYINKKDCAFFTDFISVYRTALERNKKFIEEISAEKLTYTTTDTMRYSKGAYPYLKEPERIKKYLRKKITLDILEDIAELSKNKDSLTKQLPALFETSKQKITSTYLCRADNLLSPADGFENAVYGKFYNAFCTYFDPHSAYFNYNEKASFVSTISSQNYSLGLYVNQEDDEQMVVEEVVPGGPAFKSEKIEKGDKIIKLTANKQEYIISCASMDAVTNIVNSDSYRDVALTLRKQDGSLYTVTLTKEKMRDDDNAVYSYVLGEGTEKTGYIKIPSFYSGYEDGKRAGMAEDVAAEVKKLKEQKITGLIIDLQYNGGGSMDEAVRMAGMFINFGPISILTDKQMKYNTLRDYNRGMLYDGPMVVLVNGLTASASEFFAGVMQDYNRAVIVGSPTLGKASMQTIMPLDEKEQSDFIKITVDRFYRVNGKSSQYTGIIPDVKLPMLFSDIMPRESKMANALLNDTIDVKLRYSKLPVLPIKNAVSQSEGRIKANASFTAINSLNQRVNVLYNADKKPLPITFSNVFDDVHSTDSLYKDVKDVMDTESTLGVSGTYNALGTDEYVKTVNEYKIKNIKRDPYILEGMKILLDLSAGKDR
ncbi:S41 family peptidase [Flavobacterium sp. RHBU_24]|uniref:S41 family peptidase n=1 Tax=Flavobacterium sp. RHBU_24 TaxID=3391185 RepID=UPI00398512A2